MVKNSTFLRPNLCHDGGQEDVLVVLPAIQAALLLQLLQVHVPPRLQP